MGHKVLWNVNTNRAHVSIEEYPNGPWGGEKNPIWISIGSTDGYEGAFVAVEEAKAIRSYLDEAISIAEGYLVSHGG